jgi:UDP-N-acetylmuramate: L-alanyl-gamma-D-glutamyl-meso-diaminopimelate ligase
MKIHILGICGTFMGGIAILARQLGHDVSGTDANVYPPMSDFLNSHNISIHEGYEDTTHLDDEFDLIIVGNTLSRGNVAIEYILNEQIPYISGPQWLAENVLHQRRVIAFSGTHGKTTTTSMAAWVLEQAGLSPGFLIGGVAENFGTSARLGESDYFIIEADEYDTAFFDKRSKFIHYRPEILVINNIEFDHADIFVDIGDIIREFRRLVSIIPEKGSIIFRGDDENITTMLSAGCWSRTISFCGESAKWQYQPIKSDFSTFELRNCDKRFGSVTWDQLGEHNASNALAVTAVADLLGVDSPDIVRALEGYKSVKRRLEVIGEIRDIKIYDDFAHHPTAIQTTLGGLRAHVGDKRIYAVFEPRSNTMKMGIHKATLGQAFSDADVVFAYKPPDLSWDLEKTFTHFSGQYNQFDSIENIVDEIVPALTPGDHVVIMSNGGFGGIHNLLLNALRESE